jgi:hypothetical protein
MPAFDRSAFVSCTSVLATSDDAPAGASPPATSVGLAGVAQADSSTTKAAIQARWADRVIPGRTGASTGPSEDHAVLREIPPMTPSAVSRLNTLS